MIGNCYTLQLPLEEASFSEQKKELELVFLSFCLSVGGDDVLAAVAGGDVRGLAGGDVDWIGDRVGGGTGGLGGNELEDIDEV